MNLILKRSLGDSKGGEVVKSNLFNSKRIVTRGDAIYDTNITSNISNIVSIIISSMTLLLSIFILTNFSVFQNINISNTINFTILAISSFTIILNTSYYFNVKLPNLTYSFNILNNLIFGFILSFSHLSKAKYFIKQNTYIVLTMLQYLISSAALVLFILLISNDFIYLFSVNPNLIYLIFVLTVFTNILLSLSLDIWFTKSRIKFIRNEKLRSKLLSKLKA